ncbi:hypothetical protein QYE76_050331 [Lolium multiflorum]|uniref:Uncharacterized protein n=1 Tax=Lolium multiflorum TaxID=4521 RepID=A0AAD8SPR2_LOLMU|nr:hypothetical protein QYE76_050331 [Lolium multiflorum]
MNPHAFFLPSFLRAIRGNTIQSFNDIIHELVENFEKWAHREKQEINDPNNFHKPSRGTTISDIGMKGMLDDLMQKFISPISKVLFPEVGGRSLDSQHSYVVSYGGDDGGGNPVCSYDGYDNGLEIHVEDSHITLNVCLGKQFTQGQMFFVGSRCGNHVNSEAQLQVLYLHNNLASR